MKATAPLAIPEELSEKGEDDKEVRKQTSVVRIPEEEAEIERERKSRK